MTHHDLLHLLQRRTVIAKDQFWENKLGDLTACIDEHGIVVVERDGCEMLLEQSELKAMTYALVRLANGSKPPRKLLTLKLFGYELALFGRAGS